MGIDEFLGQTRIPLAQCDVYELPKNRWYKLEAKPGKDNKKDRGKLEVIIAFHVKAESSTSKLKRDRNGFILGEPEIK